MQERRSQTLTSRSHGFQQLAIALYTYHATHRMSKIKLHDWRVTQKAASQKLEPWALELIKNNQHIKTNAEQVTQDKEKQPLATSWCLSESASAKKALTSSEWDIQASPQQIVALESIAIDEFRRIKRKFEQSDKKSAKERVAALLKNLDQSESLQRVVRRDQQSSVNCHLKILKKAAKLSEQLRQLFSESSQGLHMDLACCFIHLAGITHDAIHLVDLIECLLVDRKTDWLSLSTANQAWPSYALLSRFGKYPQLLKELTDVDPTKAFDLDCKQERDIMTFLDKGHKRYARILRDQLEEND